ncbi:rod shape-determining protein RodA [Gottschalkia purinilytica]|uniref:Peptidoglycan glycosyltransferase RodA n=1 Tax=Gottschalkia purinilytica TaxID=1503 RepID=A0A0L0WFE2_GOTPU|nr:rod shape-determining protein RodA [Gottschalkia purinilytica]KNF10151.1 rod shape-determining protein RodA [Gottschalkia purinilytica]
MFYNKSFLKKFDFTLFITTILLSSYGILVIASATASNDSFAFIKTQVISTILGIIVIFILLNIDYEIFGKLYLYIYVISNVLLILVLFIGVERKGAQSWIAFGGFQFQPAEFVKIGIIICVAKYIDINKNKINELFTLGKILIFSFIPAIIIFKQPDLGTALVFIFFIFVMLFVAGLDVKYILYAAIAGICSLPLVWFSLKGYQRNRIFTFLDPSMDVQGSSYQVLQSKIAIGSGKVFGMGLYNGSQTQFGFLPEKHNDFIFAVIGEELGLIGGMVLMILFFIMMYRLIMIAKESRDLFGSLIVTGVAAMMFVHILENIGMTMGILPVTGIPLPFISYGGTFQLSNMICIGLVLNIGVRRDGLNF